MLSRWPIRNKLLIGLALLAAIVAALSWSGFHGVYAYRELVKSVSWRVNELPLASELGRHLSRLRVLAAEAAAAQGDGVDDIEDRFRDELRQVHLVLTYYRRTLDENAQASAQGLSNRAEETGTVAKIETLLKRIDVAARGPGFLADTRRGEIVDELERLESLAIELPSFLHRTIHTLREEVRLKYRTLIVLTWVSSLAAVFGAALFVNLFYKWVFRPLRILIKGSRKVAAGNFNYRITLDTNDEMAELASALNSMTARFQDIRDDLDRQVQERTKQVVRNEQLASVGFLAAGVAHEINNPLASIAMCAESLEGRLGEIFPTAADEPSTVRQYLRMIQSEAFRCKQITEKLLDFSRLGEVRRQETDLRQLVLDVVGVVRHVGRFRHVEIAVEGGRPLMASVNPQEIKQVVLNLVTNAVESCDAEGGRLEVRLDARDGQALLEFRDNGCGMGDEVREHLFEPFFTRRRNGQGTGLGLSIAYRIVADHEGILEADSAGPGKGSTFRVRLPLSAAQKENRHRQQAA